jgi:hypothetical protein
MRTLVYKRTHVGDPDREGRFGIHDCMGRVRSWHFEAVIGVGGVGAEPRSQGIAHKVNWIGIGPHKKPQPGRRGPLVTFDHFLYFEAEGPDLRSIAPTLAARMEGIRFVMNDLDAEVQAEVEILLDLARSAPPSVAGGNGAPSSEDREDSGCGGRGPPAQKPVKGCSS